MNYDVLCDIFTQFMSDSTQVLNNIYQFMLVCKDWYEVTQSGNFWSILFKMMIKEEKENVAELQKERENNISLLKYRGTRKRPKKYCLIYRPRNYSKYLERLEKIRVNHEIIYKELTRKLMDKRSWFSLQTDIENFLIIPRNRNNEIWSFIVKYLETKPYGKTPQEICRFKIYDRTLLQYLFTTGFFHLEDAPFFYNLVDKYDAQVLPCLRYASYELNDNSIIRYVLNDIERSKGRSIPNDVLVHLFDDPLFSEENLDQIIDLLKKYRQSDFRRVFLKKELPQILEVISENYTDFAKKLNYLITKLKVTLLDNCSSKDISQCICDMISNSESSRFLNLDYNDTCTFEKEICDVVKLGYGKYLDKIPIALVRSQKDTLNLLKLVCEQGIDLKQHPNLIHEILTNNFSEEKIPTLKYLIEECDMKYCHPDDSNICTLNRFFCQPDRYLEHIEYLSSKLGLKLTSIDTFVDSLESDVKLATLKIIFDYVTEKWKIKIKSGCLSRVYYDWRILAAPEDANLETQKKVLRYLEAKFPEARI